MAFRAGPGQQRLSDRRVLATAGLVIVAAVAVLLVALALSGDDRGTPPTAASPPAASSDQEPAEETPSPEETTPASPPADEAPSVAGSQPAEVMEAVAQAGLVDESRLESSDSVTVKEDGAVVEDLLIEGTLNVKADDVVIRNVRIESNGGAYALRVYPKYSGTLIENVEIDLPSEKCSNAGIYGGSDVTVRFTAIRGCGDGLKIADGSVYEYNDIRLARPEGEGKHLDGMQNSGASDVVIRGNYIDVPAEQGGNAAIFTHDHFDEVDNVLIEGNYLNGGNYTLFVEGEEGTTNVRIVGNEFGRDYRYGLFRFSSQDVVREDNVWADTEEAV